MKVTPIIQLRFPFFSHCVICPIFVFQSCICIYKLVRIYIYVILRTCKIYTIHTYAHYYKDSLGSFLHFQARSFPFPRGPFLTLLHERKRDEKEKEDTRVYLCVFLRYFRVNAALGVSKPTICVEDYLIC